jgi:hypothetical protein
MTGVHVSYNPAGVVGPDPFPGFLKNPGFLMIGCP